MFEPEAEPPGAGASPGRTSGAQLYRALEPSEIRWFWYRVPYYSKNARHHLDVPHRGDLVRFNDSDNAALELRFREDPERFERLWWEAEARTSTGPSPPPAHADEVFEEASVRPRSTRAIEDASWVSYVSRNTSSLRPGVSVRGGVWDADLETLLMRPAFWPGHAHRILRATWFAEKGPDEFVPLRLSLAEQIEEGYRQQLWRADRGRLRRFDGPPWLAAPLEVCLSGDDGSPARRAARDVARSPDVGTAAASAASAAGKPSCEPLRAVALFAGEAAVWLTVPPTGLAGRLLGADVLTSGESDAIRRSPSASRTFWLRRGYAQPPAHRRRARALESDEAGEQRDERDAREPVEHLVLVVHGVGQSLDRADIAREASHVRTMLRALDDAGAAGPRKGRIEVVPVQWRKVIRLGADEMAERLQPRGAQGLRSILRKTVVELLHYFTPLHKRELFDSLVEALNGQHRAFLMRNPEFSGKVHIVAHSLGSVMCFDLLCNQPEWRDSSPTSAENSVDLHGSRKLVREGSRRRSELFPAEEPIYGDAQGTATPARLWRSAVVAPQPDGISAAVEAASLGAVPAGIAVRMGALDFCVDRLVLLGSPLGVFLALRGVNPDIGTGLGTRAVAELMRSSPRDPCSLDGLPDVRRMYNLFHPHDPVGHRLEILAYGHLTPQKPPYIPSVGSVPRRARKQNSLSSLSTSFRRAALSVASTILMRGARIGSDDVDAPRAEAGDRAGKHAAETQAPPEVTDLIPAGNIDASPGLASVSEEAADGAAAEVSEPAVFPELEEMDESVPQGEGSAAPEQPPTTDPSEAALDAIAAAGGQSGYDAAVEAAQEERHDTATPTETELLEAVEIIDAAAKAANGQASKRCNSTLEGGGRGSGSDAVGASGQCADDTGQECSGNDQVDAVEAQEGEPPRPMLDAAEKRGALPSGDAMAERSGQPLSEHDSKRNEPSESGEISGDTDADDSTLALLQIDWSLTFGGGIVRVSREQRDELTASNEATFADQANDPAAIEAADDGLPSMRPGDVYPERADGSVAFFRPAVSSETAAGTSWDASAASPAPDGAEPGKTAKNDEDAELAARVQRVADGPLPILTEGERSRSAVGRLDFAMQESALTNQYLSALSAHFSYWSSPDVALFILRALRCRDVLTGECLEGGIEDGADKKDDDDGEERRETGGASDGGEESREEEEEAEEVAAADEAEESVEVAAADEAEEPVEVAAAGEAEEPVEVAAAGEAEEPVEVAAAGEAEEPVEVAAAGEAEEPVEVAAAGEAEEPVEVAAAGEAEEPVEVAAAGEAEEPVEVAAAGEAEEPVEVAAAGEAEEPVEVAAAGEAEEAETSVHQPQDDLSEDRSSADEGVSAFSAGRGHDEERIEGASDQRGDAENGAEKAPEVADVSLTNPALPGMLALEGADSEKQLTPTPQPAAVGDSSPDASPAPFSTAEKAAISTDNTAVTGENNAIESSLPLGSPIQPTTQSSKHPKTGSSRAKGSRKKGKVKNRR